MACYHPLKGYQSRTQTANGKYKIVFNSKLGYIDKPMSVPCGQCVGCRLDRSKSWAIRCMHEAQLHSQNCFITLTYSDEYLPSNASLRMSDFQKFMKRLRKRFGAGIRFYHCGEYGEKLGRPHYHACIFGFDFPDKEILRKNNGYPLYTSKILESLWQFGFSSIGTLTFESAAYVARYILKKVNGELASSHYETIDMETGVVDYKTPEYTTMSRRPGIAAGWFDKYYTDVYPRDNVIYRGREYKPPRFYDFKFEQIHSEAYEKIKLNRLRESKKLAWNNTDVRLAVREFIKLESIKKLPRVLK